MRVSEQIARLAHRAHDRVTCGGQWVHYTF
jgi:hypothetical protein